MSPQKRKHEEDIMEDKGFNYNDGVLVSAYEIIPKILLCDNIIDCAQHLLEFVKAASTETNKVLVLRRFYEDLSINAATPLMGNFIFG